MEQQIISPINIPVNYSKIWRTHTKFAFRRHWLCLKMLLIVLPWERGVRWACGESNSGIGLNTYKTWESFPQQRII